MANIVRAFAVYFFLCTLIYMWYYYSHASSTHSFNVNNTHLDVHEMMDDTRIKKETTSVKTILFWNEAYGGKDYFIGQGKNVFKKAGCTVWQCTTTAYRSRINVDHFDAIVFHLRSYNIKDLPVKRRPEQRYIFWSIESPFYPSVDTELMAEYFNWTMTYRLDSDVIHPYGWFHPTSHIPLHPNSKLLEELKTETRHFNYSQGKTKMAAWFVSNCNAINGRNYFVKLLMKHIDIDIYGNCGTLNCSRTDEGYCRTMMEKQYKFYLALENSFCLDYVTEKFFTTMKYNIIPIVLSYHQSHDKMAPSHSYINAAEYESVGQLADYLMLLNGNDTLYNEYFWWKPYFTVYGDQSDLRRGMCHLCAKLHETNAKKVYSNMTQWWHQQSECKTIPSN